VFCIVLFNCVNYAFYYVMYSLYMCNVLCVPFHCVVLCTVLCVNVYWTTATGFQPNCSKQMYVIKRQTVIDGCSPYVCFIRLVFRK
jgi:hypothetical protein